MGWLRRVLAKKQLDRIQVYRQTCEDFAEHLEGWAQEADDTAHFLALRGVLAPEANRLLKGDPEELEEAVQSCGDPKVEALLRVVRSVFDAVEVLHGFQPLPGGADDRD